MPIPKIQLKNRKILAEVLKEIPRETAFFYQFLPFEKNNNTMYSAIFFSYIDEILNHVKVEEKLSELIYKIEKKEIMLSNIT